MIRARVYGGIWYWPTYQGARAFILETGGCTCQASPSKWSRIVEYQRGYAVQAGRSGNYAGPGVSPMTWPPTLEYIQQALRGEPIQNDSKKS